MTSLQRYIAEEIATDHLDGLLSRREAVRRLGLLGMSAAAASALIASCSDERAYQAGEEADETQPPAPAPTTTSTEPPPGMAQALPTSPITWAGPGGELQGAWAAADAPEGAVLVIHENKGLNDWTRSVVGRLAGAGYSALAIDLLSGQGGTATFSDPAEATAALGNIPPETMIADIRSGLTELASRSPGQKLAAVGFCMGGGLVWRLLDAGAPELAAAVPFYGPTPDNPDFSGSADVAVLAFYGALDNRVNATEPAASAALDAAGMPHDVIIEPGADHAFFNDTGERYNAVAAVDAWTRMQDWFEQYL
ncbi:MULTISPECIES: dienelactone hydrolase family protein [Mycolicibacterium]|jgi:carboxymethylenebutenolidase|uniref:Carboxymethylenebutenolidase n=2 Tax=Mycolicibacterium TaxID=1866885 RepID=A0A378TP70_9MYCO|nr:MULTISPECIES: dienelactone hydrolase family protein [Mycolicibacterium]MCV7182732.1 dienelactone hydrolase family protein [Mycolicibacterium murale]BBY89024.1 carboxymethylenebutenolidase [Mycolicibacterium tokaiense]GFG59642.1 carboxymethylenebutenolidase [Mycolicibacterium murale]STZ62588.1 carboxymethylenebutenolidase [Mycolicibacterium tokaiense]